VLGGALLVALDVAFAALFVEETVFASLGTWFSGAPGRQFILNTDETVGGANAADYVLGALSGQIEIRKTAGPGSANITADNFLGAGGVTINAVPCRFHNDPQTTCDPPGITATLPNNQTRILYVGVDINTTITHSGGDTASATFDITVTVL
jgi:hypothetical protein